MTLILEPIYAWTPTILEMSPEQAAELNTLSDVVRVSPAAAGLWLVEPNSRVGVLVGSDWELRIKPRLTVPKLNFLIAYAWRRKGYRDLTVPFEETDDVVSALASGFSFHAERALHLGVLHGYIHVEERRQDLRGRVRFADQLSRLPGLPLPLEVSYDDFAIDILENRMLKTAAEVLLRLPRIPIKARTRLLRIRALLEDVELIQSPREARAPPTTRLNERYASSLALAQLVLQSTSLDLEHGKTVAVSFTFDMNKVFEDFVTAALEDALRPYGGWLEAQHKGTLDEERNLDIFPDITWRQGARIRAIVDAKYKSLVDQTMPNADAYQMLAYCIGLGVLRGYLVYAKESGARRREHTIKQHGYVIAVRAFDVGLEPEQLLAQVDAFASEIARPELRVAA